MITYSELFLLLTLIVSIVALVIDITKKKYPPSSKPRLFLTKTLDKPSIWCALFHLHYNIYFYFVKF